MATQHISIAQSLSTDALFRAWGQAIHNALAAMGTIVQTADTGQANWTTATRPGLSPGTVYEIWRFNDSLQSTSPAYMQISFGNNSSQPTLYVAIGTGTNGAGTLTGRFLSPRGQILTATAAAQNCYLSSTTSRLTIWLEADANNGAGAGSAMWTVERPRDNTGGEIGTGIMMLTAGVTQQIIDWVTAGTVSLPATISTTKWWDQVIFSAVNTLIGTQMTAFTVNPLGINYQVQNPALGILLYRSADLGLAPPGTLPTITLYGVAHAYINTGANPSGMASEASSVPMMLYE